jgi:hypothetical protein
MHRESSYEGWIDCSSHLPVSAQINVLRASPLGEVPPIHSTVCATGKHYRETRVEESMLSAV